MLLTKLETTILVDPTSLNSAKKQEVTRKELHKWNKGVSRKC